MTSKTAPPTRGRFGKLRIFGEAVPGRDGNYLPCMCDCGVPVFVLWRILNSGSKTSCSSCRPKYKSERLYGIWSNMKSRVQCKTSASYKNYGGRGIELYKPWNKYVTFREWALANGYRDDLTIERKDNNGNYDPDNCTWIPLVDQATNRRSNIRIEYDGKSKILTEWSNEPDCIVSYATLYARTRAGWDLHEAMITPPYRKRSQVS